MWFLLSLFAPLKWLICTAVLGSMNWVGVSIVHNIGFGSQGIVVGSWAASLMAASGGATVAGGIVASLQAVGATGTMIASVPLAVASFVAGVSTCMAGVVGAMHVPAWTMYLLAFFL